MLLMPAADTKQYRNPNFLFKYYISKIEGGGGLDPR